jgi:hypothetical protein
MQQSVSMLSQRESYVVTKWVKFLWWLSTAEKELLVDCIIDRNRYAIVGMSVLGTWAFATLAWTYFFSTIVTNLFAVILLGLFMGCIILSIDRALIKGINKRNKNKLLPLFFRGLLAVTIGTFMAQPALLYLFDKEIHVQISLDNEQKKRDKSTKQDAVFFNAKTELLVQKTTLEKQLADRYNEVAIARQNFIAEADGTGGSKKIGMESIAREKKQTYEKLATNYQTLTAEINPRIHAIDSSLLVMDKAYQQEQKAFEGLLNDGFLTRIEALNNLIKTNSSLQFRYWLLVVILVLIELMPVIAKTILPAGTYDEKAYQLEIIEKEILEDNLQKELQLKKIYNQLAFENDAELVKNFFNESKQKRQSTMKTAVEFWQPSTESKFDTVWQKLKDEILTKQEN